MERCVYNPGETCADARQKFLNDDCRGCLLRPIGAADDRILPGKIPNTLQQRHGHPKFYQLCEEEMDLHGRKNHDYAKGGAPMGNFNRVSYIKKLYPKMDWSSPAGVAIGYLLKQFDAALWLLSNGHEAKTEGHKERWQDVSVYSKIISILIEENKQ